MNTPYITDRSGEPFNAQPANPAAGAQLIYTLPTGYVYLPVSFQFLLVTAAAAANRYAGIEFTNAGAAICHANIGAAVPAGNTVRFHFGLNFNTNQTGTDRQYMMPWWMLSDTYDLRTKVLNIQAADQISGVVIYFHRWRALP